MNETKKKTWAECTPFERTWLLGELQRVRFDYLDRKITSDWAERAAVLDAAHDALATSNAAPEAAKESLLDQAEALFEQSADRSSSMGEVFLARGLTLLVRDLIRDRDAFEAAKEERLARDQEERRRIGAPDGAALVRFSPAYMLAADTFAFALADRLKTETDAATLRALIAQLAVHERTMDLLFGEEACREMRADRPRRIATTKKEG